MRLNLNFGRHEVPPHLCSFNQFRFSSFVPSIAQADLWINTTDISFEEGTGGWTNKVDLADLNGDGLVDILFANGSAYSTPGEKENNQILFNIGNDGDGVPLFEDLTDDILGLDGDFTRVIKARDVNNDGVIDILVGNTYGTQSRLFLGKGGGEFEERSDLFPQILASVGDLELGDIDGDGDLDIILADWNLGEEGDLLDPFGAPGGKVLVWRNELLEASGRFVDITEVAMPNDGQVAWSWDLEFTDVDNDSDLDIMASCKVCPSSMLFLNDKGVFKNATKNLPGFTNNYDFEPMFIRTSGDKSWALAVVTINDGDEVSNRFDLREHIFVSDENGKFTNQTSSLWPDKENLGADDNVVVILDYDSDSDPDFLIGALGDGDDRLHINHLSEDGTFHLDANDGVKTGLSNTPGTLGIALADLNGDGKLDVVQSQGELADPEEIWIGDEIKVDSAKPEILSIVLKDGYVLARIHDNKSPSRGHDWRKIELTWADLSGENRGKAKMQWVGEFYWRANIASYNIVGEICATDAAGNQSCEPFGDAIPTKVGKGDEASSTDNASEGGCQSTQSPTGQGIFFLFALFFFRPKKRS